MNCLFPLSLIFVGLASALHTAWGSESPADSSRPLYLEADQVTYDDLLGILTAEGNVIISDPEDPLHPQLQAQKVTYNKHSDKAFARGNVYLFEGEGTTVRGDLVELKGNLKEGVIRHVGIRSTENRKIAANLAIRKLGPITHLYGTTYTACNLCTENPQRPPVWQLKAKKIIRNEVTQDVHYYNTHLELLGVPVFFTPYLSTPDPEVTRRSGFLPPIFGYSARGGGGAYGQPYFWNLGPKQDLTITPFVFTHASPLLQIEYRHQIFHHPLNLKGSITHGKPMQGAGNNSTFKHSQLSGYGRIEGGADLTTHWRMKLRLEGSTDPTYLRRYELMGRCASDPFYTSSLLAEGFYGRSYATFQVAAFQALKARISSRTYPRLFPLLSWDYVSPIQKGGHHFYAQNAVTILTRQQGSGSRHLHLTQGIEKPWILPHGFRVQVQAQMTEDFYSTSAQTAPVRAQSDRLFPQAALDIQWPLYAQTSLKNWTWILVPRVNFIMSPTLRNQDIYPNEDSSLLDMTPVNFFSLNRFTGTDRVDDGQRINYGITLKVRGPVPATLFLGQSYSFSVSQSLPQDWFAHKKLSDILGSLAITPWPGVEFSARGTLNHRTLSPRFGTLNVYLSRIPRVTLSAGLSYRAKSYPNINFPALPSTRQLTVGFSLNLTDHWNFIFDGIRNLGKVHPHHREGDLSRRIGLVYTDECFQMQTLFTQEYFRDRDVKPKNMVWLTLSLATLGDFNTRLSLIS